MSGDLNLTTRGSIAYQTQYLSLHLSHSHTPNHAFPHSSTSPVFTVGAPGNVLAGASEAEIAINAGRKLDRAFRGALCPPPSSITSQTGRIPIHRRDAAFLH